MEIYKKLQKFRKSQKARKTGKNKRFEELWEYMEDKVKICFFCHGNIFRFIKNPVFTGFSDMTKGTLDQVWASND